MNKQRKQRLHMVCEDISKLVISLESIEFEENNAYDNLPVGFQESERGRNMESIIDILNESRYSIKEAIRNIEEEVG